MSRQYSFVLLYCQLSAALSAAAAAATCAVPHTVVYLYVLYHEIQFMSGLLCVRLCCQLRLVSRPLTW